MSDGEETTPDAGEESADEAHYLPGEDGDDPDSEADDQPAIEDEERAEVPDGLADIDPEDIEDEVAKESDESGADGDANEVDTDTEGMTPDGETGASPAKAGELYVSLVQSVTNAQIRKHGGEDAEEVDREHFEDYDLAHHFNETMDYMGVGSDLEPHEALLMATALSVGDPLISETDVLDSQIDRLMDKAMNGGEA